MLPHLWSWSQQILEGDSPKILKYSNLVRFNSVRLSEKSYSTSKIKNESNDILSTVIIYLDNISGKSGEL